MARFLRALLNARAVALFPSAGRETAASVVVTTRGILASSLAPIGERLAGSTAAIVEPAPDLKGEDRLHARRARAPRGPAHVALLAQLAVPNARDLQAYLVILQTVAGYLLYREQRVATENLGWVLARTSGLLDLFRRAGAEEDYSKAVRIAVDGLRDYLGCARVVSSHRGRLQAISGVPRIDAKSAAHQPVEAALREAILHGERINFPADQNAVAHQLLAEHTGATHIVTLPLPEERGALLLEWSAEPDGRTPALLDAALPFCPAALPFARARAPQPDALFLPPDVAPRHAQSPSCDHRGRHRRHGAAHVSLPLRYQVRLPAHPEGAACRGGALRRAARPHAGAPWRPRKGGRPPHRAR